MIFQLAATPKVRYRRSKCAALLCFSKEVPYENTHPWEHHPIVNVFLSSCRCHPNTVIFDAYCLTSMKSIIMSKNKQYVTVKMFFKYLFKARFKYRGLPAECCVIIVVWFAFYCEWKVLLFYFLNYIIYSYITNCLFM